MRTVRIKEFALLRISDCASALAPGWPLAVRTADYCAFADFPLTRRITDFALCGFRTARIAYSALSAVSNARPSAVPCPHCQQSEVRSPGQGVGYPVSLLSSSSRLVRLTRNLWPPFSCTS
jgi:hypothetical protein